MTATLGEFLRWTPTEIRHIAEEHGEVTVNFIEAGLSDDVVRAQAEIAAHFGRLWLDYADMKAKRIIDELYMGDKYTPEGTERGEPVDMSDVIGE